MFAKSLSIQEIPALVDDAHRRIKDRIYRTPLRRSGYFSERTGANVFFKYESLQFSGSFKARGAFSKLGTMTQMQLESGVVAASTGNHGVAVAMALKAMGRRAIIFMPENASTAKIGAVRRADADIRVFSNDSGLTEVCARQFADTHGMTFISPYNDPTIIGGQGTIGRELLVQLESVQDVFVSVGGGGLLSGIAGYLKGLGVQVNVVACSAMVDHAMYASVQAGKVVEFAGQPTLADGCAGGVEENAITVPLVRDLADEWALISEAEIHEAMRLFIEHENQLLEGSTGLAIAALLQAAGRDPERYCGRNIVIVVCGSRVSASTLRSLIA